MHLNPLPLRIVGCAIIKADTESRFTETSNSSAWRVSNLSHVQGSTLRASKLHPLPTTLPSLGNSSSTSDGSALSLSCSSVAHSIYSHNGRWPLAASEIPGACCSECWIANDGYASFEWPIISGDNQARNDSLAPNDASITSHSHADFHILGQEALYGYI